MLAFIGPVAFFAIVFFFTFNLNKFDKASNAFWAAIISTLFVAIPLFGAAIPGIATSASEKLGTRWVDTVDGEIKVSVPGQDGVVNFSYITDDGRSKEISTDGDLFSVIRGNFDNTTVSHVCDETPDLIAPWTIGTCYDEIRIPEDKILTLN